HQLIQDGTGFTFSHKIEELKPQIQIEFCNSLPLSFSKRTLYLDADRINGKLKLRKWKKEDRIYPLGIQGSQKVSTILKDAKLTVSETNKTYVIHDDKIIQWVIGLKIGRKAIANNNSDQRIKITTA